MIQVFYVISKRILLLNSIHTLCCNPVGGYSPYPFNFFLPECNILSKQHYEFHSIPQGLLMIISPFHFHIIFAHKILQHSRLFWWDGNVQMYSNSMQFYTKLLYILTLPSHQNNLERCKNFWTKIYDRKQSNGFRGM